MADELDNDEQWLYGDQQDGNHEEKTKDPEPAEEKPEEPTENGTEEPPSTQQTNEDLQPPGIDEELEKETEETQKENEGDKDDGENDDDTKQQNGDDELDDDDDDSEDDVNVVIEDIKTTPSYTSLNIKRGGLLSSSTNVDKSKQQQQQAGKFNVEEFDQSGTINGVPATEYNLDSLEDKPWRKPGADITDYFNYGFNEDTWRAYCERQKRMRMTESGAGLAAQMGTAPRGTVPILNDNSKYSGNFLGARKAGPPPGRRMTGAIDVIGGTAQRATPTPVGKVDQPKMNVIQVMTADRREYSRKPAGFPDMSVPPPTSFEEYQPEYGFNPEPDPYYGGYEPTQDSQWGPDGAPPNWVPTQIKPLTPGLNPVGGPPRPPPTSTPQNIHMVPPPITSSNNNSSSVPTPQQQQQVNSPHSPNRQDSKDRERESEHGSSRGRERSERPERERSRDRDRERSHRRKRSRSRSKRHKSRSRSPSHRSHRKKKGRRHDDSD